MSYNNGPTLLAGEHGFLMAWHSWRPPGREPFSIGGDIFNVWMSQGLDSDWKDARLAFPQFSETKYASLSRSRDFWFLACQHRPTGNILIARSADGEDWFPPEVVDPLKNTTVCLPSLAATPEGSLLMAFTIQGHNGIWLMESKEVHSWSYPRLVCELQGHKLTRPKLSLNADGTCWISCQTDHWGAYTKEFSVHLEKPFLEIAFSSSGGAGNAVWTLNAVEIINGRGELVRKILFGPGQDSSHVRISTSAGIYENGRGSGFDGPVEEILRELGTEVTRSLVYSQDPRRLRIDISAGQYHVKVTYCSWVASTPATQISFNAPAIPLDADKKVSKDCCYFFRGDTEQKFKVFASTPEKEEHNRPSAVCEVSPGQYLAAWTSFSGENVGIVGRYFKEKAYALR